MDNNELLPAPSDAEMAAAAKRARQRFGHFIKKAAMEPVNKVLEINTGHIWENNYTQFARLLSEIYGLPLSTEQYEQLKESMDLGYEDIDEIFDRAMLEFERAKRGQPVRKTTPPRELEEFVDGSSI